MIVNYSIKQAISSCHHAKRMYLESVLLWRSVDHDGTRVLLVIPFFDDMHYGIFDSTQIRRIDL